MWDVPDSTRPHADAVLTLGAALGAIVCGLARLRIPKVGLKRIRNESKIELSLK